MTSEELQEILDRCTEATPGPWREYEDDGNSAWRIVQSCGKDFPGLDVARCPPWAGGTVEANADFISHARTDIPRLLEEVEKLRNELAIHGSGAISERLVADREHNLRLEAEEEVERLNSALATLQSLRHSDCMEIERLRKIEMAAKEWRERQQAAEYAPNLTPETLDAILQGEGPVKP